MKTLNGGASLGSLVGLVAAAALLGACQQAPDGSAGTTAATEQNASGDQAGWQKKRCCRRATRSN